MKARPEEKKLQNYLILVWPRREGKATAEKLITALVRAVREDAIKISRKYCPAAPGETCEECDAVEAAIRGKGEK